MSVTYGFFNSINGDRVYNAEQMSEYFKGLITDGVYELVGNGMRVLAAESGMQVNVQTGRAIIDCRWIDNNAVKPLDITPANPILNRYTAVVVRLNYTDRVITIETVDGVAAADPVMPEMTNTSTVKELCLAMVYVAAGSSSISQNDILDKRVIVTGLIDQMLSSMLDQWFRDLTGKLSVDTFIKNYLKAVTLDGTDTSVDLDMTGYEYEAADIINVYINGLFAIPGTDYTLDTEGTTPAIEDLPAVNDTDVVIQVLKSRIGMMFLAADNNSALGVSEDEAIIYY